MDTHMKTLSNLLNEHQVAEVLGVSVPTIRRWRLLGQGPKYYKIGAAVRYDPDGISNFLNSRPTGGEPESMSSKAPSPKSPHRTKPQ
jgi:predicted DNA-binding transcriptional regulator AlpA